MKLMMLLPCILLMYATVFAQGTVTVTGTDLSPTFSPGASTPIVRLSFVIVNTPMIRDIKVDRTGSATNTDIPTAKLWRDLDKDDVVDGSDVQLGQTEYFQGSGTQSVLFPFVNYFPSTSENLLIVYDVAFGANTSNTAGASMPAGYITGGNLTVVTFAGITTGNQPLPVELTSFTALVQNKTVTLNWQTATEVNNYGFEIERKPIPNPSQREGTFNSSLRGKEEGFEKIGFVQGHGNSNSPKEYSFTDNLARDLALARIQYRLKQIDFDGTYEYSNTVEVNFDAPVNFVLEQNYPNPFNPETVISYLLSVSSLVVLKVYDVLGREIATLVNEQKQPGIYEVTFDASSYGGGLPSGVYIYTIKAGEFSQTKKMIVLR